MGSSFPLYWIPLLPLLGAALNLLVGRKLPRGAVHLVACLSVLGALVVSMVGVFFHLYPEWAALTHGLPEGTLAPNPRIVNDVFEWIVAGEVSIHFGLVLDPLSAVMILVVTFVGFLIHLYSTGYMSHDPDYARFFAYLNLFTGAMLILVLGDNLAVLFVGWEGVGVCSYLLIGFWYDKSGTQDFGDENATAGKKAFLVNRIGDFAFVLGMFILFWATGTLNIEEMTTKVDALTQTWTPLGLGTVSVAGAAALLLFIGATGKSAQIPLYVWLPDAMAGPTPVSALIHAATMVTAGVYMVVRLNFVYMLSPTVLGIVAVVGALTAFVAATIGFAQNDIKKVLAYSTVSQLGYMFIGAGVAAFSAAIFHLFTHAFFKACLFLGSGAVIHALAGEQDMRNMGGLRKKMPVTHLTMLASTLAIAGFIGFSGFFSKDEILWKAIVTSNAALPFWLLKGVYVLALAGALCTAFYMFRLYFMTFSGDCRASAETLAKFHPPGWNITGPLVVLAVGAVGLGVLGLPEVISKHNFFHHWLAPVVDRGLHIATTSGYLAAMGMQPVRPDAAMAANHGLEGGLMVLSFGIALLGIIVARHYYNNDTTPQLRALVDKIPRLHKWVYNKYFVDELYFATVVRLFKVSAALCFKVLDKVFVDILLVNGSAKIVDSIGRMVRWLQNGHLQHYIAVLVIGLAVLLYWASQPPDDFVVRPEGPVSVGETVTFDARRPNYDRRRLEYRWDFNGDGEWDHPKAAKDAKEPSYTTSPDATFVYDKPGAYKVVLEVRDLRWHTKATESAEIEVQGAKVTVAPAAVAPPADRKEVRR